MFQDKAQSAVNGHSLNKDCNAVLGHLRASLRACRAIVGCSIACIYVLLGKSCPLHAKHPMQPTIACHADMCSLFVTLH